MNNYIVEIYLVINIKAHTIEYVGPTETRENQGCQIFLDTIYQNGWKYTKLLNNQMAITCLYVNSPSGYRIYQTLLFQGPPKITQIGIFGSKIHIPSGNPGEPWGTMGRTF
jgi:hypothetical protein